MAYNVSAWGKSYNVYPKIHHYGENGNLAIQLYDVEDHCPYARLTVNLSKKLPANQAYVDTNNCPWAEDFIVDNGLGKPLDDFGLSGFCVYPLYEFDLEKLNG